MTRGRGRERRIIIVIDIMTPQFRSYDRMLTGRQKPSALIYLSRGQWAIVDGEDYAYVNQHTWHLLTKKMARGPGYAVRRLPRPPGNKSQGIDHMHWFVLRKNGIRVDHINGNGLNNRKSNLRVATQRQNMGNQVRRHGLTSKYKGVSLYKQNGKWVAHGRAKTLGYFDH